MEERAKKANVRICTNGSLDRRYIGSIELVVDLFIEKAKKLNTSKPKKKVILFF